MIEKPDAADFRNQLAELKQQSWLGAARRWWLDFLFFYTDIQNVASILKSGVLMSRARAESTYSNFTDSANPEIIEQTEDRWKDHVRFYFRPRTPTLFNNEGFRPIGRRIRDAHCPIPVYL